MCLKEQVCKETENRVVGFEMFQWFYDDGFSLWLCVVLSLQNTPYVCTLRLMYVSRDVFLPEVNRNALTPR